MPAPPAVVVVARPRSSAGTAAALLARPAVLALDSLRAGPAGSLLVVRHTEAARMLTERLDSERLRHHIEAVGACRMKAAAAVVVAVAVADPGIRILPPQAAVSPGTVPLQLQVADRLMRRSRRLQTRRPVLRMLASSCLPPRERRWTAAAIAVAPPRHLARTARLLGLVRRLCMVVVDSPSWRETV